MPKSTISGGSPRPQRETPAPTHPPASTALKATRLGLVNASRTDLYKLASAPTAGARIQDGLTNVRPIGRKLNGYKKRQSTDSGIIGYQPTSLNRCSQGPKVPLELLKQPLALGIATQSQKTRPPTAKAPEPAMRVMKKNAVSKAVARSAPTRAAARKTMNIKRSRRLLEKALQASQTDTAAEGTGQLILAPKPGPAVSLNKESTRWVLHEMDDRSTKRNHSGPSSSDEDDDELAGGTTSEYAPSTTTNSMALTVRSSNDTSAERGSVLQYNTHRSKDKVMAPFLRTKEVLEADVIAIQEPWDNPYQGTTHHPANQTHQLLYPKATETGGEGTRVCMLISRKLDLGSWRHGVHSWDYHELQIPYTQNVTGQELHIQHHPAIVLKATCAPDISTAVLFAQAMHLEVAVVGGGHGTNGSAATTGLLIDLTAMNKTSVDVEKKTITAEGGCRWEDIDIPLGQHGLATVGGRVGNTGIGGLTLGGGVGWLSGKYGLVADNLLSVKMVLADGRIVTASQTENPDLFWAARGAGQCFGVAVEFTYQAYDLAYPIWAGQLMMKLDALPAVVDFVNQFPSTNKAKAAMNVSIAGPPANMLTVTLFYPGGNEEAEVLFAPLLALEHIANTTRERPYTEANTILTPKVPWGIRRQYHGVAFAMPLRVDFLKSLADDLVEFRSQVSPDAAPSMIMLEITHQEKMGQVPVDSMAFAGRRLHQVCFVVAQWSVPEHDLPARKWVSKTAAKLDGELERMKHEEGADVDLDAVRIYSNYDGLLLPAEQIFKTNLPRLTTLKERYDPKDVFCTSYALLPKQPNGL
ncbi:FAD-binding oxidoreductase [Aspergillus thermomutatus]|uniref:FAD-binding PCMH-type domain-containing protein n=1 Tax=Aspergillus thermomutatus TaxID=41047 RepID=A0A397FZJ4_ASPTH|nr:uncharacterized protein CDV56_102453 [Aspergillus thermomutatus]RHZ44115.1 hypothetical protein CDV56_102453 [Aspergillus thermomutatus]